MSEKKYLYYKIHVSQILKHYYEIITFSRLLRDRQLVDFKIDWLTLTAIVVLGYALIRSGLFLVFYLLVWNLYPPAQFFLYFNPLSYETYLIILSFYLAWYSVRILMQFPKQFQIHLWLFQQIRVDQLSFLSSYYIGLKSNILEILLLLGSLWLIFFFPHFSLYFLWFLTISAEIFCFLTIRKPQILLVTPSWLKRYEEIIESSQKKRQ